MKNQFFGDNRDLLKFDLVYEIAKSGLVDRFTYIPMLTEDEPQEEEPHFCRHEATGGAENQALLNFLDNTVIQEKRDIRQLNEFLQESGIKADIYSEDRFYTLAERRTYFDGIGKELLTGSLILIDPDKGLEECVNDDGNLMYTDLKNIYERMDENSCLMFTQRFPYEMYGEYLEMRCEEIQDMIPGARPVSLDDLDSIIFFLTRSKTLESRLLQFLGDYTKKYFTKG